jgi:serine/threonine protein kinase
MMRGSPSWASQLPPASAGRSHEAPRTPVATPPDALRSALETALGAQYDVLRLIARGGMGAVYLARERFLDRLAAIKVLPRSGTGEEARERFLREARIAAQLTHPNIVPLYSLGQARDTLFYVMGYVDGESLEARLTRTGAVSHEVTRRVLHDLADALDYAHRRGVVHRDVKPDNILIERETERAILADFGIAKRSDVDAQLTPWGMILGTPEYMSPEQAAGQSPLDGRSDLYSVGVIGYRMLSGRMPFERINSGNVLYTLSTQEPARLSGATPSAPASLMRAITRCLAKEPADRFSSAAELRQALVV